MAGYVDKTGLQIFYNILNSRWMNEQGVLGYNSNGNKYAIQRDASTNKLYVDVPPTPQCVDINYSDLVTLRNNKQLIPGQHYKIIDYSTTANYRYISTAGHDFELIVKAVDIDKLSEDAQACPWTITTTVENETGTVVGKTTINNNQWDSIPGPPLSMLSMEVASPYNYAADRVYCVHWTRSLNAGSIIKINVKYNEQDIPTDSTTVPSYSIEDMPEEHQQMIPLLGADIIPANKGAHPNETVPDAYDYRYSLNSSENNYSFIVPSSGSFIIRVLICNQWNYAGMASTLSSHLIPPIDITITTAERTEAVIGDNYFDKSILSWDLKYSLDNDRARYNWANTDGKGVIYYMKDDVGNEAPYDFKNILYNGYYTFDYNINGTHKDGSHDFKNLCYANVINKKGGQNLDLPHVTFKNTTNDAKCCDNIIGRDSQNISFGHSCYSNKLGYGSYNITFSNYCYNNIIGNGCSSNEFGEGCSGNLLKNACNYNTFGNECIYNVLGNECIYNEFGPICHSNILGDKCTQNKFINSIPHNVLGGGCSSNEFNQYSGYNILGAECNDNKFGASCQYNIFGPQCDNNKFGDFCQSNTFGQASTNNTFGSYCLRMNIGKKCSYNIFATSEAGSTARSYWQSITLDDSCGYNVIWNSNASGTYCQNYHICHGVAGTSSNMNKINLAELGAGYKIHVAKNSSGQIKQFCLADIIQ